jgi:tetratricopeptide (TPR) repeat protein
MRKLNKFRMAIGLLRGMLGIFSLYILSPLVVLAQSTNPAPTPATNSSQMAVQMDSLSRSVERLANQVNSELRASNTRIEAIKEGTDRTFWIFVILGAIGSFIGGAFVLGERARERQHHKDYAEERTFYEQRAQRYEQRQQEIHQQMLNITKNNEERNKAIHSEVLQLHKHQVIAGQDAIEHTGKLFNLVETNLEKINKITTAVASGAKENVATLNEVLTAFQRIMEFKVVEAQDAAKLVERMKEELKELEVAREQQIEDLLRDAERLIRKRFEYTNPDPGLQRLMVEFRTKMDGIQQTILMKYTKADSTGQRDWRYGEIFLRRGVIAYFENDPAKARDMLKIAEKFLPFSEKQLQSMSSDQRYATAFTRFYLALIEKNYGDIRKAQNYIENSYVAWGKNVDNELLTPTTRAEILSYAPGGIDKAREAIAEILPRVANLKQGGRTLAKHDAICALRAHMILGNTHYLQREWKKALLHYQNALKEDKEKYYSYYVCHSIAQVLRKLGDAREAQKMLEQAYKHLLDSRHLETKVALDSRILLNALAYLCTRAKKPKEAVHYQQTIEELLLKIQKIDDLELRLFSLEQKRQVSKDEFWKELFKARSLTQPDKSKRS